MRAAAAALGLVLAASPASPQGDDSAARRYFYEDIFIPFFAKDADGLSYRSQRPGSAEESFPAVKGAGALRVFVIGGSIARRYMGGPRTSRLDAALREVLPEAKIEALSCGMGGYDSDREAQILEEVLDYSPDAVVLLTGHNERRVSPFSKPPPLWILHAQDRLARIWRFKASVRGADQGQPRNGAEAAARARHFERNLREMTRRAKARGVAVVLAIPPVDYRDVGPHNNSVQRNARFIAGLARSARGDHAGAIRIWRAMLPEYESQPDWGGVPVLLFHIARAAERLGDRAEADRDYERIMRVDFTSGYCGGDCRDVIRRVAREEDVPLADLDAAFRRAAVPHLPGLEMFDDAVHWNHRYDGMVSAEIASALATQRRFSSASGRLGRLEGLRRPWSPLSDDAMASLRYAAAALDGEKGAGEGVLSIKSLAILERVYEWHPRWFSEEDAALEGLIGSIENVHGLLGAAWGMPALKVPRGLWYWHVGQVLLEAGRRPEAVRLFSKAAAADPSLGGPLVSRAVAETLLGEPEAAERDFKEAERRGCGSDAVNWRRALTTSR